jgi:hypothetical protein
MSQGSGGGGGSGNDRDRFHRGGKSIMMRDNGRGPPRANKDYSQLLSTGDRREESSRAADSGGGGGSRSHKNISYRREGDTEEREPRGRAYMDYKGK